MSKTLSMSNFIEISNSIAKTESYIAASKEIEESYRDIAELVKNNHELWLIIDRYASALTYQGVIEIEQFYLKGVEDGKKSVIDALGVKIDG